MPKAEPKRRYDIHRTLPSRPHKSKDASKPPEQPEKTGWSRRRKISLGVSAAILALLIFIISWDFINVSRATNKLFGSNAFSLLSPKHVKGSERGRVNILLIGYSKDDPGHSGAKLTDSLIVLSLSTKHHDSYMLSIPRDLYVNIPHFGHAKINETYQDGGPTLLKRVIGKDFAIPIDRYVIIDYAAVRDMVNALGGIDVNVKSSDKRGLYDPNINKADGGPLKLTNGWHKLDGQTALNFTRARGDDYRSYGFAAADFDRTQHQRQVLAAIQRKISWKLVLNPLENGQLFQALSKNIKTDIRAGEARPIFRLFHAAGGAELKSLSLNKLNKQNYLQSYGTPTGASALIPAAGLDNFSQIQAAIKQFNR